MIIKAVILLYILGYVTALSDLDCGFDNGLCKWIDDGNNWLINWVVSELNEEDSSSSSHIVQRGICLSPSSNKKLIQMAKGKPLTARLWSPVVFSDIKIQCVNFVYKIENLENSKLTLMRREMGACQNRLKSNKKQSLICDSDEIWMSRTSSLEMSSNWHSAQILLNSTSDYKLILEGTIPSGNPNAKICVDNITSSADPCQVPVSEEITNARSYQSWVELFGITFAGALALGLTIPIAVFVVCLFERKRRRGKKNKRIIRHADELDLPEVMNTTSCDDTNPLPQRFTNTQVGVGHPRLMNRAMSTPAGTNGQGGNYTMGKRNGTPQQPMGPRSSSGQMSHTMGRGGMEGGWMMSSQHGDLMENDEYTIDSDYTTHRQMSVPANGYIPVANQVEPGMNQGQVSSMGGMQQVGVMYQNRQIPQQQSNVIVTTSASNNPFGTPANIGAGQDNRSLAGSHVVNFATDENRATPGLPFYPPRYEEAMGFNHGQHMPMEEKPPLLPPRVPESSGSGVGPSCTTPLPPAPPPLPLSGHPSAGRFTE